MDRILRHYKFIFSFAFLLAISGLALLLYDSYNEALTLIKDQYNSQQILVARQTAVGIEKNIKSLLNGLSTLSNAPAIKTSQTDESRKIMNDSFDYIKNLYVSDLCLLDSKGTVRISLMNSDSKGADFSNRDFFRKAKVSTPGNAVFEFIPFLGGDKGKRGIVIAMPVFSPDDEFKGAIFYTIKVDELIKSFAPFELASSKSCVIDSSGNVLCNPKDISIKIMDASQNMHLTQRNFLDNVKTGTVYKGDYVSPEGVQTVAVSYPVRIADQTWSMIIATPEESLSKLLKPFSIKYTIAVLLALTFVASASFFIIFFINRLNLRLDSMVKTRTNELSFSEGKFRGMVETINDFVWEVDADGKYVYVSPIADKLLGYQAEELIGKTIFDLMPEQEAQKLKTTLQDIGKSKNPFNNLERISIHKNGQHIILETNGAPILDSDGNLSGFRGADRDTTARKQAEKELQKYAVKLEESRNNLEQKVEDRTRELEKVHDTLVRKEKLAAIGELSSSVSHELRNPLGVIKNAIYYFNMKMDTFEDEVIRENIKIITNEINIANKIISSLLDFARDKSPVSLDIDINQLVREMLSKSLIPQNITVIKDFAQNPPHVSVDPTQVAQVFFNLIENAVQSMEKGGVLKIITRVSSNDIEVLFSDEGCGIPDKFLEMIFEPLYTTKVKGVGLGLAVSKSMAEANAGSISVESTEGKGSTFTVRFMDKTSPHVVNF